MSVGYVIQAGGITQQSRELWDALKGSIPPVEQAWIGFNPHGWPGNPEMTVTDPANRENSVFRGLVLACSDLPDDDAQWPLTMLFLSGCNAGYRGTGPTGTKEILVEAGFSPDDAELAYKYEQLHWTKDRGVIWQERLLKPAEQAALESLSRRPPRSDSLLKYGLPVPQTPEPQKPWWKRILR